MSSSMMTKSHTCHWPGCKKAFTRAEHPRRHALNHEQSPDGYTCERCSVHFNRPDLLSERSHTVITTLFLTEKIARHMVRHAKRDEEAGGPGLGVLETRKRTRRTPNGTIVTRPAKRQARNGTSSKNADLSSHISVDSTYEPNNGSTEPEDYPQGAPVSPPQSARLSIDHHSDLDVNESDPLLVPLLGGPYEPYVEPIPRQFGAADGSWRVSAPTEMDGDLFSMDTGISASSCSWG